MGNIYLRTNDITSALSHFEQSINILRELNQDFDLGAALYDYALVLKADGSTIEARTALTEALTLFEKLELPQEQERVRAALDHITQV
jgi:tetratricopeptide (TPR) repeat protein